MQSVFLKGFTDKQQKPYSMPKGTKFERGKYIMYRTVYDLTAEELDELRSNMFWSDDMDEDILGDIDCYSDIPDSAVFAHYDGISFVEDDFFCNTGLPF